LDTLVHAGIVPKWLYVGSHKQRHSIGLVFWRRRSPRNSNRVTPSRPGRQMEVGMLKSAII